MSGGTAMVSADALGSVMLDIDDHMEQAAQ